MGFTGARRLNQGCVSHVWQSHGLNTSSFFCTSRFWETELTPSRGPEFGHIWLSSHCPGFFEPPSMRARGRGAMEFEGWGRIRTQNYQCKLRLRVFLDLEKNSHFKNYTFLKVDKYHLYHKIIKITCIFIISLLKYFRNSFFFFALVVICIFHLETPIPEG